VTEPDECASSGTKDGTAATLPKVNVMLIYPMCVMW